MSEIFHNDADGPSDTMPGALPRPADTTLVARAAAQDWQESGSGGFLIKPLFEDRATGQRTWLMRVDPGASAPLHDHAELEQIYVIEGTFSDDETTYRAGDFAVRAPGVMHTASSETGALVLLVYST